MFRISDIHGPRRTLSRFYFRARPSAISQYRAQPIRWNSLPSPSAHKFDIEPNTYGRTGAEGVLDSAVAVGSI